MPQGKTAIYMEVETPFGKIQIPTSLLQGKQFIDGSLVENDPELIDMNFGNKTLLKPGKGIYQEYGRISNPGDTNKITKRRLTDIYLPKEKK